ncbi:MAG TPA: tyrosine-type recombinase/integrase [Streptosporangiaceae bacterium]|nr:tyrosine-type recombinase/integrase [Streptosporangiaceae bacterium]
MGGTDGEPQGSARLELVGGVRLLHPEDAVVEAMLRGWGKQQRGGRGNLAATVRTHQRRVRALIEFTNEYPWRWTAAHMDEWSTHLVAESRLAKSTIRQYQLSVELFCEFITSPHYHWAQECEARFGVHPVQVCYEWNTLAHLTDYEGRPGRRPLTREECQALFNCADSLVERAVRRGRKGALTAYRDATVLKVIYAWGLRCTEACKLDLADWHRNPQAPELGRFGTLQVRWGKRSRGSAFRRRPVLSLMPWAVESVEDYLTNIRPRFGRPELPAMWLTERGGRLRPREIEDRFAACRDHLGMDPDLTPHCLRHSFVTHLVEDGADPEFVKELVGHRFISTTGIYTGVSGDYMNTMMRKHVDRVLQLEKEKESG